MKRSNLVLATFVVGVISLGFANDPLVQADQKKGTSAAQLNEATKVKYTCSMHPEVKSDKPGKCPKCKMNLVLSENPDSTGERSPSEKIAKSKELLDEAKEELMEAGKYSCCTNHSCNTCAFEHQSCTCYKSLKAGKPVCNECYAGWQRGDGADKNIKKNQVKTTYSGHMH